MQRLHELPLASIENAEPPDGDTDSPKYELVKRLEAEGHRPILVGRAVIVIERCDAGDWLPSNADDWGTLCLSVYSDPGVSGLTEPTRLYVSGSRWGIDWIREVIPARHGVRIYERAAQFVEEVDGGRRPTR